MKRTLYHLILPVLSLVAFFLVAATPAEVLGCRNRGLLALLIAFLSTLAGLAAAVRAVHGRRRGGAGSERWAANALILPIAPVAFLFLA